MSVQPTGNGDLRLQIFRSASQQLESKMLPLSKQQVERVVALIDAANFWKMATEDNGRQGTDGAEWVLEGVQGGQYHVVTRWDAGGTTYGKALLELLRLSNYNPPADAIY